MSAYAKKSRFTELCPVCDRLCCETRDCISKGVKDDGIYCKYWQHSFAADLMFNLFELKTHVESLEAERDALRARCEKLEWLVEVQEFYMYRLRNPGGWSTPGMERAKIGVAWQRRSAANDELRAMYLAATEVK